MAEISDHLIVHLIRLYVVEMKCAPMYNARGGMWLEEVIYRT
jgi:hypothetical protein